MQRVHGLGLILVGLMLVKQKPEFNLSFEAKQEETLTQSLDGKKSLTTVSVFRASGEAK